MKCIILAGGFATRLWPLTENKAKPLLHLKDRPIISHIAEGLPEDMEIIISTNAVFESEFKKWAKDYPHRPIKIFVEDSFDDEFKKGALGATAMVIGHEKLDEDLLLIAGDNYFGFKMKDFIDSYQNHPILAAYDIQNLDLAKRFGVVVSRDGQVVEFQEKPQEPKSTLVSTGCYIFPKENLTDIVDYAKEKNDDLGGIFEYLLKKGVAVNVFSFKEKWFDVGSFDGYLQANRELLDGQVIENGRVEKEDSKFKGGVYLGDRATIRNSTLENTVILKNCKIINCVLRNCIVDEGAELKNIDLSHKMIRQGSRIEK
ncbi:NDP-sugar synthase [Candidatus Peregrinibacteria bacterium]|nr:NDP-sugar synthase [Candidatus Peregrinibacteria bacterium]